MAESEPPIVLDADGEPIREGRYRTCPICGLMFREPLQDVADQSTLGVLVPGGPGQAPGFEHSELWHLLLGEHERRLEEHAGTHTMIEALEVIVRLQRECEDLREWQARVRRVSGQPG